MVAAPETRAEPARTPLTLGELPFADLSLEAQGERCRYKRLADSIDLLPLPSALWTEAQALYQQCMNTQLPRFRAAWPPKEARPGGVGMRMRVQRRETPYGPVFIARRIDHKVRPLEKLGLPAEIIRRLRDPQLRAGLVLFAGGPGAGKTTAACATLLDRLEHIGGFTWTAENPVEYDIQGPHGHGQCYQEEVADDQDVYRVFTDTLRSSADTFYIGEIREAEAARAACLAAASGMLVLSTIHADNPQQALVKLGMLAGFPAIAQSLRALITLRIDHRLTAANGTVRTLRTQPFFVVDEAQRMKIRDGNMASLNTDIDHQAQALQMGRTL